MAHDPHNLRGDLAWLGGLALFKLLIQLSAITEYGYFIDELYFVAASEHLDWGYVDMAPLTPMVIAFSRSLVDNSLFFLRLPAALAGALLVGLTGWLTRELGGGRYAQVLAALAVIIAPFYLVTNHYMSMNALEPLCWTGCAYVLILISKGRSPRLWLLFGLLAGIGLQTKPSTLFFGFSVVAGLLLTPARHQLRSPWCWAGGTLALLIFSPFVWWQAQHAAPMIELLKNVQAAKNYLPSPLEYLQGQVLLIHPLGLPVWLAGLYYFLATKQGRPYRALGWAYLVLLGFFILQQAKVYYLAPFYPVLLAGGGVWIEQGLVPRTGRLVREAVPLVLLAGGALLAPLALPVLPVETYLRYADFIGIKPPKLENRRLGKLPQMYADMHGWPELVATVARVYQGLPPEEQAQAAIFGSDYGIAGAVDLFGRKYGLPEAISGHQNYFLWGPGDHSGEVVVAVGPSQEELRRFFTEVEVAATIHHPYAMPSTNGPIFVCRGPRIGLHELWPQVKRYL